jgi:hypothetical protein
MKIAKDQQILSPKEELPCIFIPARLIRISTGRDVCRGKGGSEAGRERTRKKLMEVAFKLAGQSESGEASIVEIGAREESRDESSRQGRQDTDEPQKPNGETDSHDAERSLSDWA